LIKIVFIYFLITVAVGQVVITEIMYNLEGSDSPNEFVELFNISTVDTANLSEWKIRDIYSEDTLEDSGFGLKIPPRHFALIMEGDYPLESGIYSEMIPQETIIIKVDDSSIGNSLSTTDSLFLVNAEGIPIDSIGWSGNVLEGFSLEKRYFDISTFHGNWLQSLDSLGTPGLMNSVAPLETDGSILVDSISHNPMFPTEFDETDFFIPILNHGNSMLSGSVILIELGNEKGTSTFSQLGILDTIILKISLPPQSAGRHVFEIELMVNNDLNLTDNYAVDTLEVSYPFGSVVFNEFLSIPDSTQTEFVELFSFISGNLEGWQFSDNTMVNRIFHPFEMSENDIIVIAGDSSIQNSMSMDSQFILPTNGFPALNNSGDALYLLDRTGMVIDSLIYNEFWSVEDHRSLEKFRPEYTSNLLSRWGVAVNTQGMTPGQKNSLFVDSVPSEGNVRLEPNPFSPDGDGIDDVLIIHYSLPFDQAILKVELFDINGFSIARPVWNLHVPREGVVTWDGLHSNGNPARIGIYVLLIAAMDENSGADWESLNTIVLAKKL